jgi:hypothetical protein
MDGNEIAEALSNTLISPNEADSNFEPANVVDGLYAIARGLHHVARAVEGLSANADDAIRTGVEAALGPIDADAAIAEGTKASLDESYWRRDALGALR